MKRLLSLLSITLLIISSCKDDGPGDVTADFSVSDSTIAAGTSVIYSDLSTKNVKEFNWEFEGGTPATSQDQNPTVRYDTEGVYSTTFTVSNSVSTSTRVANNLITVIGDVEANYSLQDSVIDAGESISFTDESVGTIDTWEWTFEGPETLQSTQQNPGITFLLPGQYSVKLVISNQFFTDEIEVANKILVLPSAGLIAKYLMNGNADDSSPNSNNGIIRNTLNFETDRKSSIQSSASFDGISNAIDLEESIAVDVRTFSIWFKSNVAITSSLNEYYPLIARDTDFFVTNNADEFAISFTPIANQEGKIIFNAKDDTGDSFSIYSNSDTWAQDEWYHVAAVIDPIEGMKLYINGVLQNETLGFSEATKATNYIAAIGTWGNLNDRYFDGNIDDVRLYSVALDEDQVNLLYLDR